MFKYWYFSQIYLYVFTKLNQYSKCNLCFLSVYRWILWKRLQNDLWPLQQNLPWLSADKWIMSIWMWKRSLAGWKMWWLVLFVLGGGGLIPLENFPLICGRHYYRWGTANFDQYSALMSNWTTESLPIRHKPPIFP